jgi:hypothetical protein
MSSSFDPPKISYFGWIEMEIESIWCRQSGWSVGEEELSVEEEEGGFKYPPSNLPVADSERPDIPV